MERSPHWTCELCTLIHTEPIQQRFLACAACGNHRKKRRTDSIPDLFGNQNNAGSNKESMKLVEGTAKVQRKAGILPDIFNVSSTKKLIKPIENTAKPVEKAGNIGSLKGLMKPVERIVNVEGRKCVTDVLSPSKDFFPGPQVRSGKQWLPVAEAELGNYCPVTLVRDVLPLALAHSLASCLSSEKSTWSRPEWRVHDKYHEVPRRVANYSLGETHDVYEYQASRRLSDARALEEAAKLLIDLVKSERPEVDWQPTIALANYYADGNDCVGFHSDHINNLGPRPVIVGLSLGACRKFEIKSEDKHLRVYLPHNSAIIMWDDCQERWMHSVPRCSPSTIYKHALWGTERFSLTFRMAKTLPDLGKCFCGREAALKAKDGKYYLFCKPYDQQSHCKFWKPCDWATELAARMKNPNKDSKYQH